MNQTGQSGQIAHDLRTLDRRCAVVQRVLNVLDGSIDVTAQNTETVLKRLHDPTRTQRGPEDDPRAPSFFSSTAPPFTPPSRLRGVHAGLPHVHPAHPAVLPRQWSTRTSPSVRSRSMNTRSSRPVIGRRRAGPRRVATGVDVLVNRPSACAPSAHAFSMLSMRRSRRLFSATLSSPPRRGGYRTWGRTVYPRSPPSRRAQPRRCLTAPGPGAGGAGGTGSSRGAGRPWCADS